jgi:exopolysaccharide biosynthesis protein
MKNGIIKILFFIFVNIFIINNTMAEEGYEYSFIEKTNQKIHLLKIDLNKYDISLASAHNSVFGREKAGDIAERENAEIAINAGFFQIGGNEDGRPTGTLIINGKIFGLRTTKHYVFAIRNNKPYIENWQPKIEIQIAQGTFTPEKYNKFANNSSVILYSDRWGYSTLTAFKNRNEIIISKENKVIGLVNHGNNNIPPEGYVLSLPKNQDVSFIKIGDLVKFQENHYSILEKPTSAIMGIPFLIIDGLVNDKLSDSEKHARTAIGIDKDGKIIVIVAECIYTKSPGSLTLRETQDIFKKKNIAINELNVSDIKKVLLNELSSTNNAEGISLKELANLMLEQNCISAINLDGGGSSTLYINGKYINQQIGDKDEGNGLKIVRPVADAIIFKKK